MSKDGLKWLISVERLYMTNVKIVPISQIKKSSKHIFNI